MILEELEHSEKTRPKFADVYSMKEPPVVRKSIKYLHERNAEGPFEADVIFYEQFARATEAFLKMDNALNIEELAKCGAMIMRMMEFVDKEV